MQTSNTYALPVELPDYTQLICQYDPERRALWYYMNATPRPCFTPALLNEIRSFQEHVRDFLTSSADAQDLVRYLVLASATPAVFNLGGDIELFARLIHKRDCQALYDYGRVCVEAIYANTTSLDCHRLTTISLVQGTALGGGFEAALSSNVLIAEQDARMGFPEMLFNLFPGMGAMSLLSRKVEPARAERLIIGGNLHTGSDFLDLRVVDELAGAGEGVLAVNKFIRRHERYANGRLAMRRVRQRVHPLTFAELMDIVAIWVEAAMNLSSRDLHVMDRIVAAQSRLDGLDTTQDLSPEQTRAPKAAAKPSGFLMKIQKKFATPR